MSDTVDFSVFEAIVDGLMEGHYVSLPEGDGRLVEKLRGLADILEHRSRSVLAQSVGMSVHLNATVTQALHTLRSIREMSRRMTTISASTEELVSTVQAIARTSELAATNAHAVEGIAVDGAHSTEMVVDTMRDMVRTVTDTAERVTHLAEASSSIGAIVKQIEQIARQTNILAMNATIEAARAGAAGKGFAVVAGEVKNLANQTAKATQDIRKRIDLLRAETDAILDGMTKGADSVREGEAVVLDSVGKMRLVSQEIRDVTTLMQEISDHLGQQRVAAQVIAENLEQAAARSATDSDAINAMIDTSAKASASLVDLLAEVGKVEIRNGVVHLAKSDHMIWRRRLAEMLAGRANLNPNELADHKSCRLGKWYYAVQDAAITQHPAFRAMEAAHEKVHHLGIHAARLYQQGDFDGAVAAVDAIEGPSQEVQSRLDELIAAFSSTGAG